MNFHVILIIECILKRKLYVSLNNEKTCELFLRNKIFWSCVAGWHWDTLQVKKTRCHESMGGLGSPEVHNHPHSWHKSYSSLFFSVTYTPHCMTPSPARGVRHVLSLFPQLPGDTWRSAAGSVWGAQPATAISIARLSRGPAVHPEQLASSICQVTGQMTVTVLPLRNRKESHIGGRWFIYYCPIFVFVHRGRNRPEDEPRHSAISL